MRKNLSEEDIDRIVVAQANDDSAWEKPVQAYGAEPITFEESVEGGRTMTQATVKLLIPFEALVESVRELSLKDKLRLWELLGKQIAQAEEDAWDQDPTVQAEIREARAAYLAGDYVTIDEYAARQQKNV